MTLAEQSVDEPQLETVLELSDYEKACMDNAVSGMLEHLQLFADGDENEFVRNFVAFDKTHQYQLTSLYTKFNDVKDATSEEGELLHPEFRNVELVGTPIYHPSDDEKESPVNVRLEAVRERQDQAPKVGKFGLLLFWRQKQ